VEKVGAERAVDLRQLVSIFSSLGQVCDRVLADKVVTTEGQAKLPEHGDAVTAVGSPASAIAAGAMRSRDDAIRLLDMVCQYLERNEPTNPAPLLIRRAKRLMTMDFMEIIRDLAPDGLTQIQTIAGLDKE
jgi:type VI secretion system protein ImpA